MNSKINFFTGEFSLYACSLESYLTVHNESADWKLATSLYHFISHISHKKKIIIHACALFGGGALQISCANQTHGVGDIKRHIDKET